MSAETGLAARSRSANLCGARTERAARMNYRIAMFWARGPLSYLEQLSMTSFVRLGFEVELYSYGDVGNTPAGVTLCDAADIQPRGSTPGEFRWKLLSTLENRIWVNPDVVATKPIMVRDGYLLGWADEYAVSEDVVAVPRMSAALRTMCKPAPDQSWSQALEATGEICHARPEDVFQPYSRETRELLLRPQPKRQTRFETADTCAIKLHSRWAGRELEKFPGGMPHPDSILGNLLAEFGINPASAPLPNTRPKECDKKTIRHYRRAARVNAAKPKPTQTQDIRPLNSVVAITTMRNEGAFILDWVAYHMAVGVTHFLVYTNDCDDPTVEILDALQKRGVVTRVDNPFATGERPQRAALEAARNHPKVTSADAVVVMDVDEFMNIHTGDGTLKALFQAAGDPDLISMTWRLFGTSGRIEFDDLPPPLQFISAAARQSHKPHQCWGMKTILRHGAPYAQLGVHRPLDPTGAMPHWTNGSGQQMPEKYLIDGWRSSKHSWGYELVTLNHYAVRSVESFLIKRDRGRTNHISRPQDVDYWNVFNRNDEEDTTIQDRWQMAAPQSEEFRRDPELAALHDKAIKWHRTRVSELKNQPQEATLFKAFSDAPKSNDIKQVRKRNVTAASPRHEDKPVKKPRSEAIETRADAPLTGLAADEAFRGLAARIESKQRRLTPLAAPPQSDRIVIVSSMKNEGCFILEWIAYHLSIGVTHFLIYTNDCDDPTNAILDRLSVLGLVTRRDNPFNRDAGQKPQRGALNDAAERPEVITADWVGVIDVDEFVNIHVGEGTFDDLLHAAHDPNVISMTWRFFGNRGLHKYQDVWQTKAFTACAPKYLPKPRLGWGFKSFYRPDAPFGKLGVHRPLNLRKNRAGKVRWVNGAGRVMPDRLLRKNEWFSRKDTIGYELVTLNHYILRSAESFLVKRQRGRINHVDQDQGLAYWVSRNYATETDASIHKHLPRAKARLAELIADAELARLHTEAVAWHRLRIELLLSQDDYRALYTGITDPMLPDAIWRARPARANVAAAE